MKGRIAALSKSTRANVPVRFQADADLNEHILLATLRRQPEVDFKTAMAAELAAVEDREVLERCLVDGRILVTHDRKTMPLNFYKLIEKVKALES